MGMLLAWGYANFVAAKKTNATVLSTGGAISDLDFISIRI